MKEPKTTTKNHKFSIIVMFFDWMYLSLSDCDGMCICCNSELKERCKRRKSK